MSLKYEKGYTGRINKIEIIECSNKKTVPNKKVYIKNDNVTGEEVIKKLHNTQKYSRIKKDKNKNISNLKVIKLDNLTEPEDYNPKLEKISRFKSKEIINNNKNDSKLSIMKANNLLLDLENENKHFNGFKEKKTPSTIKTEYTKQEQDKIIMTPLVNDRFDNRGVIIKKGAKNHKIAFKDKLEGKRQLTEIINIESYKQFNAMYNEGLKKYNHQSNNYSQGQSCCLIV